MSDRTRSYLRRRLLWLLFLCPFLLGACSSVLDTDEAERLIKSWAEDIPGQTEPVTVSCPEDQPLEAGHIFLCELSDSTGDYHARVTVLNDAGDIEWELRG